MRWVALLSTDACGEPPSNETRGIATWALQFTQRVAHADEAVVLEVEQSLRLFGGEDRLRQLVHVGAFELGVERLAWAPTSLAALACVRVNHPDGLDRPLAKLLDAMPLGVLTALRRHAPTLARLGCKTLADVRQLPRGGLSRRFDAEMLAAMDQAYGLRPEAYDWVKLPETFFAKLELPSRVDTAPALLFGARRLLVQLGGWLAARRAGVTRFTFSWCHDSMRSKHVGDGGELELGTAEPTQNVDHLARLLSEHLDKVQLEAPAGEIALAAKDITPIVEQSRSLIPDARARTESLNLVLERIKARLGERRVLSPVSLEDHRPEFTQRWQVMDPKQKASKARLSTVPQPAWILKHPMPLAVQDEQPLYQGPLQLLLGPHRLQGGWWRRDQDRDTQFTHHAQRDYWVALSPHAGPLWIFKEFNNTGRAGWYLHGLFA